MTKRYTNRMWMYEYMIIKEQCDLKFLQLKIFDIDFWSWLDDGLLSHNFVSMFNSATGLHAKGIILIIYNIRMDVRSYYTYCYLGLSLLCECNNIVYIILYYIIINVQDSK